MVNLIDHWESPRYLSVLFVAYSWALFDFSDSENLYVSFFQAVTDLERHVNVEHQFIRWNTY